jgi:hypothetical protein
MDKNFEYICCEICCYDILDSNGELMEHECLTCCGDEITGEVEDYGICPTCKEHI